MVAIPERRQFTNMKHRERANIHIELAKSVQNSVQVIVTQVSEAPDHHVAPGDCSRQNDHQHVGNCGHQNDMNDTCAVSVVLNEQANDNIPQMTLRGSFNTVKEKPAKREIQEEDHDQAALVQRLSNDFTDRQYCCIVKYL